MRALAHPLRLRILSLLAARDSTAAEVARELDVTPANASYHLRILMHAGFIAIAAEERIRGGLAKRYHYRPDPLPEDGSSAEFIAVMRAVTDELLRRTDLHVPGQTWFTDAELWLPPRVWDEVCRQLASASAIAHEAAEPPRTDGSLHTGLTLVAFRMCE